jgi:hypothetical protein
LTTYCDTGVDMNKDYPVFIHPGFPKTATTTLQQHLFNRHGEIISVEASTEIEKVLFGIDGMNYDQSKVVNLVKKNIEQQINRNKKCIIWSSERMVMEPYLLGIMVKRVHSIFPEAQIIFTIRNQKDMINSIYYGRALQLSGTSPSHVVSVPSKYMDLRVSLKDWLKYSFDNWYFSYLCQIDYDKIISLYEQFFKKENIHVFLFEDFVSNQDVFLKRICNLMNVSYNEAAGLVNNKHLNPSLTSKELAVSNLRLKLVPVDSNREAIYNKIKLIIPEEIKRAFRDSLKTKKQNNFENIMHYLPENIKTLYREGNRKINKKFGLEMEKYNYEL